MSYHTENRIKGVGILMVVIPIFPNSSGVIPDLRQEVEQRANVHLPYAEFNFTNLHSWDIKDDAEIAEHNQNLVISLADYVDATRFFSFIGVNAVGETARVLLSEAKIQSDVDELRLVPESVALELMKDGAFLLEEDPDGSDYVFPIVALSKLIGPQYRHMRQEYAYFTRTYGSRTTVGQLDLSDSNTNSEILDVFEARENGKTSNDSLNEYLALKKLLATSQSENIIAMGVKIDEVLRGFMIYEKLPNDWVMAHFWKGDTAYRGIYRYIMHKMAIDLAADGYRFLNFQQDLGIPGLREAKLHFSPAFYLKKYTVKSKL